MAAETQESPTTHTTVVSQNLGTESKFSELDSKKCTIEGLKTKILTEYSNWLGANVKQDFSL